MPVYCLSTMKGSYADPEVTGVGYNVLIKELGDHRVPENWVQHPVINTEEGTNPGAPLAWGSPENPDDVVAGYGYVAADTSEVEETSTITQTTLEVLHTSPTKMPI